MIWQVIKPWIYPEKCIVCGKLLESVKGKVQYMCYACEHDLLQENVCIKCGKPYALEDVCMYCGEMPRGVFRIMSLFPYSERYKESVKRWKYKGIRRYGLGYAELIASELIKRDGVAIDVLIPIPISSKRYEQRGFNQALDLANAISELTHIPVWNHLSRTRHTKPQSACTKQERRENIRGTIKVSEAAERLDYKRIAFIDDIYTTGSTVQECIKVIQENTKDLSEEIYVVTVCIAT